MEQECFICGQPTLLKARVDDNLVIDFNDDLRAICGAHWIMAKNNPILPAMPIFHRNDDQFLIDVDKQDTLKRLSELYKEQVKDEHTCDLARCPSCHCIFIDDMPIYGSLTCPNGCAVALERGIKRLDE